MVKLKNKKKICGIVVIKLKALMMEFMSGKKLLISLFCVFAIM
jgi:hypothetical protein